MRDDGIVKDVLSSHAEHACYLLEVKTPEADGGGTSRYRLCSRFLETLNPDIAHEFLTRMRRNRFSKGERIITQGAHLDHFHLILEGVCGVNIQRDDILYDVEKLGPGEIVGSAALFDGIPASAHVHAETEVHVLSMSDAQFEKLAGDLPELKDFMTSVLAHILSTSKLPDERMIGKYSVSESIGHGGAGIVFKGIHSVLKMPVAIKMLTHEMAMEADFIELFRNEALTIARMNQPNIVKVYDIENAYKTVFIIMEYLDGATLDNVMENVGTMSLQRVLDIALQTCSGLAYAHDLGIIHQDINPRNVFVQSDGRVKIIDFGLACRRGAVDTNFLFPGSLHFISPEQITGAPVDERTDIYSLGITVYEMVTGQKPFPNVEGREILKWHMEEDVRDTRATFPDLPVEMHNFFMKTIRKDPSERYANVAEAMQELSPLARHLSVEPPCFCRKSRMIGMFLVFQEEQQLELKQHIEEFGSKVSDAGAVLKITRFED